MGGSRGYTRLAALTVALTIALVGLGSLVRTTGSGLGCPDWPLCYGSVIPPMDGAAWLEWSHRTLAAVVGLLIVAVAAWTWRRSPSPSRRAIAVALVALLAAQALLGRETVHRELPPELVATHLATAMVLLGLLAWLASPLRPARFTPWQAGTVRLTAVLIATVVLMGTWVVASGAGLACSTWPACAEAPVPLRDGETLHTVQWLHRLAVVAGVLALGVQARLLVRSHDRGVRVAVHAALGLYLVQMVVGALNVWWTLPIGLQVLHLVLASTIWVVCVYLVAVVRPEAGAWERSRRLAPGAPVQGGAV
jgi:heme A synthase